VPIVTVPVEEAPLSTDVGLKVTPVTAGGSNVRVAVFVPFRVAVMTGLAVALTPVVETVNVPVVCPDGMVIVAGTVAAALFDERATTVPAAGAGALTVTVPVVMVPLLMLVGLKTTEATELTRTLRAIVPV
jgi:hypothetical protein